MSQEQIDVKFRAAWGVFAQSCGHFWAPEPSYQAWFSHYLISQFGIDRLAREPLIHIKNFTESPLKTKVGGGEVRPDIVVTREPGIMMPHYANRLGKASDLSGLGLTLAVVSGFKIGASAQKGLKISELIRDADKLQLLLNEFEISHPGAEPPLAYTWILDSHGRQKFGPEILAEYCRDHTPGAAPLILSTEARPIISADRRITR